MSTSTSTDLPPWASEVIDLYESGACAQFILHGNVDDRVLLPVSGRCAENRRRSTCFCASGC